MSEERRIVLNLKAGLNFPSRPGEELVAKAKLDSETIETDAVSSTTNPDFDSELVWKTSRTYLTQLRCKNACIRVDIYSGGSIFGYFVVDVKSAAPGDQGLASVKKVKILGCKEKPAPLLEYSLYVERDAESPSTSKLEDQQSVGKSKSREEPELNLIPVLVAEGGYFQIGDAEYCTKSYKLQVGLCNTSNLKLLLPPGRVETEADHMYTLKYNCLGEEISTDPYPDITFPSFATQIATFNIRSSDEIFSKFLAKEGLQINVCQDEQVLGTADIDVGHLLKVGQSFSESLQYKGEVPVVAAFSLSTPRDSDGLSPTILLFVIVMRSQEQNKDEPDDIHNISEGELSASIPSTPVKENPTRDTQSDFNQPSKFSPAVSAFKPVKESFTQPKESESQAAETQVPRSSVQAASNVDCQTTGIRAAPSFTPHSPPTRLNSTSGNTNVREPLKETDVDYSLHNNDLPPSVTQTVESPETRLKRTLVIELLQLRMLKSVPNLTIKYNYPHISEKVIMSESFTATAGEPSEIVDGSYIFNFAASQVELAAVFSKYKLKLVFLSDNEEFATSSFLLFNVLEAPIAPDNTQVWRTEGSIIAETGVLGYIKLTFKLQTFYRTSSKRQLFLQGSRSSVVTSGKKSRVSERSPDKMSLLSDRSIFREMQVQAAKEIEIWKSKETKLFLERLQQVEAQHLSLLGREFQEREKSRVEEFNARMIDLKEKEANLDQKTEELKSQTIELERSQKINEENLKKVRNNEINALRKTRKELKDKDLEIKEQTQELQNVQKKLKSVEQELARLKNQREKKKDRTNSILLEVDNFKEENIKLSKQIQQLSNEVLKRDQQISSLEEENQSLGSKLLWKTKTTSTLQTVSTQCEDISERCQCKSVTPRSERDSLETVVEKRDLMKVQANGEKIAMLRDIQRMEQEKNMFLRSQNDRLVDLIQKKLDQLYQQLLSSLEL